MCPSCLLAVRRARCTTVRLAPLHEQRLGDFANEPALVEHVGMSESDAVVCEVGTACHVHPLAGRRTQERRGHGRGNR